MNANINIQNEQQFPVDNQRLELAIQAILADQNIDKTSGVSIVVTDNDAVTALNQQFRGINAPTDVLSFPADTPPIDIPDEPDYLGDLVIAYPYALEQAKREQHLMQDSIVLLVVHGTLHLLGYDHDTPDARRGMWAVQERILRQLNVPIHIVPALEGHINDE